MLILRVNEPICLMHLVRAVELKKRMEIPYNVQLCPPSTAEKMRDYIYSRSLKRTDLVAR